MFGCEVVEICIIRGVEAKENRGGVVGRDSAIQDKLRSAWKASTSVLTVVCGPKQWRVILNPLDIFGC